jgi:hypothetical protein
MEGRLMHGAGNNLHRIAAIGCFYTRHFITKSSTWKLPVNNDEEALALPLDAIRCLAAVLQQNQGLVFTGTAYTFIIRQGINLLPQLAP